MHLKVILSANAAFAAFVLSLLCIFVGSKEGYFEDYHILTVCFSQFQTSQCILTFASSTLPNSALISSTRCPLLMACPVIPSMTPLTPLPLISNQSPTTLTKMLSANSLQNLVSISGTLGTFLTT